MSIESTPQTFFFVHDSYLTDEQQQKKRKGLIFIVALFHMKEKVFA